MVFKTVNMMPVPTAEGAGLLDTSSQVTSSLFEQHFTQAKLGKAPVISKLQVQMALRSLI